MTLYLRSQDRFLNVATYDHETGAYDITTLESIKKAHRIETDGWFSIFGGVFLALYVAQHEIFFRIGDACFKLDENVSVRVSGDEVNRTLTVERPGERLIYFEYELDPEARIDDPLAGVIKDEDFDFGLFVSNISKSKERKRVMLGLE